MDLESAAVSGDPYSGLEVIRSRVWHAELERYEDVGVWRRSPVHAWGNPGIFEDVSHFLNILLDRIAPWNFFPWLRSTVFEPMGNWIAAHLWTPLRVQLQSMLWQALGWWSGLVDKLQSAIRAGPGQVWGAISSLPQTLYNWFAPLLDRIRFVWETYLAGLRNLVGLIPPEIRAAVREAWTNITDVIRGGFQLMPALASMNRSTLMGLVGSVLSQMLLNRTTRENILNRFLDSWPGQLTLSITRAIGEGWNMVLEAMRGIWRQVRPSLVRAAEEAIRDVRPIIEHWLGGFQDLPATFLEWVATTAGTDLALTPSRALATTGSLYSMAITAGAAAHVLSSSLNLIPTLNFTGMAQLAGFVGEAAGFEPLTRATYGVLLNDALAWPLRYHWNRQLRPKIPTEGTVFLMGRKRGLNRQEWFNLMAYHGIPDSILERVYQFMWTDPSPYWLLRMSEASNPRITPSSLFLPWLEEWLPDWRSDPWAWYKMKLMLAGFEDTDIPAFIEGFQRRMLQSPITQFKTSVRAMVREGYWTRDQVQESLRPLGVRQDEVELLVLAEELDYQKGYIDDQVRYYSESFRKGEISLQDLQLYLSTVIVKPERVAQIAARERVRALQKPKPTTDPKEDPAIAKLRRQAADSWVKAFRAWEISEEDLLVGLTIVQHDRDLALAMVATERTRYRKPPEPPPPEPKDPLLAAAQRSAIASWVSQFRKGEINADELELALVPLIEDRDRISQLRVLEELRVRPAPEIIPATEEDPNLARIRSERVRSHLQQFRKRLIGPGLLFTYLIADGLVRALAHATVITEANKRIKVPKLESPYYLQDHLRELMDQGLERYQEWYLEGEISLEDLTSWLRSLQVDPDLVTYLGDLAELRRFLRETPS